MRIYLQLPQPSRGLRRIADALVRYAPPDVEVVDDPLLADLIVMYAIGRNDRVTEWAENVLKLGKQYAVIQVCLRSTQKPETRHWWYLWQGAVCVWSYYDLKRAVEEDGYKGPSSDTIMETVNFYHAPLGADATVFRDPFTSPRWASLPKSGRNYTVVTSGLSRLSESVRECWLAAEQVGGQVFHIGPRMSAPSNVTFAGYNCDDKELAIHYAASEFVSGLRRKEGFELPAVEGLLCGARPLVFRSRDWEFNYGNHAIYLEETDRQGVIDQLVEIFKRGAPPVTPEEREMAVKRYDWKTIIGGFYERLK